MKGHQAEERETRDKRETRGKERDEEEEEVERENVIIDFNASKVYLQTYVHVRYIPVYAFPLYRLIICAAFHFFFCMCILYRLLEEGRSTYSFP